MEGWYWEARAIYQPPNVTVAPARLLSSRCTVRRLCYLAEPGAPWHVATGGWRVSRSHYGAQGAVEPAQARVCASDPVHGPGRSLSSVFVEGSEYGRLDRRRFPRERVQRTIAR